MRVWRGQRYRATACAGFTLAAVGRAGGWKARGIAGPDRLRPCQFGLLDGSHLTDVETCDAGAIEIELADYDLSSLARRSSPLPGTPLQSV